MGRSIGIKIGELSFPSKKASYEYTKNIINILGKESDARHNLIKIDKDHINFNFLNDLLKNHVDYTDKVGLGIEYFYVKRDAFNKKAFGSMIKRIDGTEMDFSWVACSKDLTAKTNNNLSHALRESIKDQILTFRNTFENPICMLCLIDDDYIEYHVDHKDPPFRDLKDMFLKNTNHEIPSIFDSCKKTHTHKFNIKDKLFSDDWNDYHKNNCVLQMLCKTCNLKKK